MRSAWDGGSPLTPVLFEPCDACGRSAVPLTFERGDAWAEYVTGL